MGKLGHCTLAQNGLEPGASLSSPFFCVSCFIFIHSFIGRFDWLNHPGWGLIVNTEFCFCSDQLRKFSSPVCSFAPDKETFDQIWKPNGTCNVPCWHLCNLFRNPHKGTDDMWFWTMVDHSACVSRMHSKRCRHAKWLQWCLLAQWLFDDMWIQQGHSCLGGATERPIDKQTG